MSWMKQQFLARGIPIAATYHCSDHPTQGIGVYRRENPWRKPAPGMLLQAAEDFSLNLRDSWCIGDKDSDIEAGRAAGVGNLVRYASAVEWRGDAGQISVMLFLGNPPHPAVNHTSAKQRFSTRRAPAGMREQGSWSASASTNVDRD
jgi:histidinol phosphatase-like enzyme